MPTIKVNNKKQAVLCRSEGKDMTNKKTKDEQTEKRKAGLRYSTQLLAISRHLSIDEYFSPMVLGLNKFCSDVCVCELGNRRLRWKEEKC